MKRTGGPLFSLFCSVSILGVLAFLGMGKLSPAAFAQTPSESSIESFRGKSVQEIEVQGLKRIEVDAVLEKIQTRVGQSVTRESVRTDLQRIFAMGFFNDIEVFADSVGSTGVKLIYRVSERPVVAEVLFEGNERLSTDDLKEVTTVQQWSILDVNKVRQDVEKIQKLYEEKGFYLAKVAFDLKPVQEDQVQVIFKINDFEKVQIRKITFLNNKRFSDSELKGLLAETQEGGFFSFMSGSGNFKEASFKNDLQRLTYYYLDHGYIKFKYENPVITVSDDKQHLYISIYVDEGEQYSMGDLGFSGDLLFSVEELEKEVTLQKGEIFSITERNLDIQRLTEKYQDLGYAFVNVVPKMNIRDEEKTIDLEYSFEKGDLVYFGEIRVVGNSKTHDKVIRRELRINEGELYSGTKLRVSRENVERLGFFAPGEVIFKTISPPGKPDVLDVEISIKERSTGTITLGAGYGSVNGFFLTTQISEINLLGRGQNLSLTAQLSSDRIQKSFNLGFTEPYAFDTHWSTGFDLFFVNFPIPNKYVTRKLGFDVRLGRPISEYTRLYVTYKNEELSILDVDSSVDPLEVEADDGNLSSVVLSVIRDKRNNRFETTGGNYQSASLEVAGLGGEKDFVKWIVNNRIYFRLIDDLVVRNSTELGQLINLKTDERTPPSERFYLGGPNNLRGFPLYSVGPGREVIRSNGTRVLEPLGGSVSLFSLLEFEYPLIRQAGLKSVVFFDAGNIYPSFPGAEVPFTIRTNWGLGIRWFSPIGPLRFEWGFPFARRPGEDSMNFNFFVGTPF